MSVKNIIFGMCTRDLLFKCVTKMFSKKLAPTYFSYVIYGNVSKMLNDRVKSVIFTQGSSILIHAFKNKTK